MPYKLFTHILSKSHPISGKFCTDERETAIAKNNDQTFVPTCQADGRYEATQCHSFSGYCWSVSHTNDSNHSIFLDKVLLYLF